MSLDLLNDTISSIEMLLFPKNSYLISWRGLNSLEVDALVHNIQAELNMLFYIIGKDFNLSANELSMQQYRILSEYHQLRLCALISINLYSKNRRKRQDVLNKIYNAADSFRACLLRCYNIFDLPNRPSRTHHNVIGASSTLGFSQFGFDAFSPGTLKPSRFVKENIDSLSNSIKHSEPAIKYYYNLFYINDRKIWMPVFCNGRVIGSFSKFDQTFDNVIRLFMYDTREWAELSRNILTIYRGKTVILEFEIIQKKIQLVSANVEYLIHALTNHEQKNNNVIISMHSIFISSIVLLENIIQMFHVRPGTKSSAKSRNFFRNNRRNMQLKVLNAISSWILIRPDDFVECPKMGEKIEEFLTNIWYAGFKSESDRIRRTLIVGSLKFQRQSLEISFMRQEPGMNKKIEIIGNERQISDYLILSNFKIKKSISFRQYLQHLKNSNSSISLLMNRSNQITAWTCNSIFQDSGLVRSFIKIAKYCSENRDFESAFAISLGLMSKKIQTPQGWETLSRSKLKFFSYLEELINPLFNHKSYRKTTANLKSPYLLCTPILLKDLTFCYESVQNGDSISYKRLEQLYGLIQQSINGCQVEYHIKLDMNHGFFKCIERDIQSSTFK